MTHAVPQKLLIVRPDAYGDIVLFEPALRILRDAWPKTEIALLIQERYRDIALVVGDAEMRWLTTQCNPYREGPDANPSAFESLRRQVIDFAPDCVVAACYNKTWVEAIVASFAPAARQISLGPYRLDLISKMTLQGTCAIDWAAIYPEVVSTERDTMEWEKNLQLARHLTGSEVERFRPQLIIPAVARETAGEILRAAALKPGDFVACCPSGVAAIAIKAWSTEKYGDVVAWLEKHHGRRTLLVGHENENDILTAVQSAAQAHGTQPAVWTGKDGQIAVLAGLLQESQFYFGNDTGALHVAAALDRPVVSIFGGGHWPRFKPAAKRAVCVVQPLPCFGCNWECYFSDAPCVKTIRVGTVKQAVDRLMTTTGELREDIIADGGITVAELELISNVAETVKRTRNTSVVEPPGQPDTLPRATLRRLIQQLQFSEADRAARLDVIQRQGTEIDELLRSGGLSAEQNVALLARMEKLQAELGDFGSRAAAQAQIIQSQSIELEQLRTELRRAQDERVRLEQRAATQAQIIESQSTELEQLRMELRQAQDERVRLEQRAAMQSNALDGAVKSLEAARARVKELHLQLLDIDSRWLVRVLKRCGLWRK